MILENCVKNDIPVFDISNSCNAVKSPIPKIIHRVWMVFNPKEPDIKEQYKINDKLLKDLHPD